MISGGAARAAVLISVLLAIAGCGRRGALEPAPGSSAPQVQDNSAGEADPVASQLPRRKKAPKITPPAGPAALDWLL